ncbi:hypothetical protein L226DRAFT_548347 [Lentinus tigrinus ALCF2SS1-7]|uniref:Ribosomal RNA methyltransferase FtsJ domain-containing protein n=1 Tax=Lentinus tigrinus ALCF2SS1-6 TaxID=1328759 RepID=A0A5C2S4V5_9APHY|nr:hypothetical protein L227DRAFT_504631 [Lentinus tigrinus ALCF2SS1-6]RPD68941.1 hypothetical protein L226DRAFT_548347 [Lentinus tigrinus ALCF2SS1-7]
MALFTQYPYSRAPLQAASDATSRRLGPSVILERRDVPELKDLVAMRSRGWDNEDLDQHFTTLRKIADSPTKQTEHTWFGSMRSIMQELDRVAHCIPSSKQLSFLDVGCAPGGFSSYILQKNRTAIGMGISLPESAGGHALLLEEWLRSRYHHYPEDILNYHWSPAPADDVRDHRSLQFPHEFTGHFPLVVLDGHALRTYRHDPSVIQSPGGDADLLKAAHGAYRDRLLITQLIIALESVTPGGTIVTRLSHIECFPAAPLLYLLDNISKKVVVHKPQTMHKSRGTTYVIAKGVFSSKETRSLRDEYLQGLKALWGDLKQGGPCEGIGRMLLERDLDFIASGEVIVEEYVDRLIELGRQTWATQVEGLRVLFRRKNIQY